MERKLGKDIVMPLEEITREFSFPLKKMIDEFKLEVLYMPENGENSLISNNDTNRPGLQLAGFYDYFDNTRVQVMGKMEHAYLEGMESEARRKRLEDLLGYRFPALVLTRSLDAFPEMLELAPNYDIPILRTEENTTVFISKLMAFLNMQLAPRITRHGVLIEIYGEGVMIMGESGVGKSETAVELIKRGHRLIADDAVEIRKASNITLVGSSPDNIRHFLELRGIGIVNARQLFGIGSVKMTERIDMVVEMELWNPEKTYDRMGVDTHYMTIMGVKVPLLNIPVKPGRNLAVILEVAAMNNRQKKMGYNAAKDLLRQLGMDSDSEEILSDLNLG